MQTGDQELGLGLIEIGSFLFPAHEAGGLLAAPGALGLVEQRDMFYWWAGQIDKTLIAKVMDVLNEGFHFTSGRTFFDFSATFPFVPNLVASQGLAQDFNKWTVAGEKHAVQFAVFVDVLRGYVQADKGFASAGHAGHEADGLL